MTTAGANQSDGAEKEVGEDDEGEGVDDGDGGGPAVPSADGEGDDVRRRLHRRGVGGRR